MHFADTLEIAAPRERVWAFLVDPQQVGSCGPGVESIEVLDETHFRAKAKVGVGFISARFTINVEMAELRAPDEARIVARGQAPGSAVDAISTMSLTEVAPERTAMAWSADVNISGTIASVGARLIQGTAEKMIGQTFDCIRTKLEA